MDGALCYTDQVCTRRKLLWTSCVLLCWGDALHALSCRTVDFLQKTSYRSLAYAVQVLCSISCAFLIRHPYPCCQCLVCIIWCLSIPKMTEKSCMFTVQVSVRVKLLRKVWGRLPSQHHHHMLPSTTSAQNAAIATSTTMCLILRP